MGVFRFLCVLLNRRVVAGHVMRKAAQAFCKAQGARRDELVYTA